MNWISLRRAWMSVCLSMLAIASAGVLALFGQVGVVAANVHQTKIPTVLHIDPIAPIPSGQPVTVTGIFYRHVEGGDAGLPRRGVAMYLTSLTPAGGEEAKPNLITTVFSDEAGKLKWTMRAPQQSGHYRLYFLYQGSPTLGDASAAMDFEVLAAPAKSATAQSNNSNPAVRTDKKPVTLIVAAPEQAIMPSGAFTVTARLLDAAGAPLTDMKLYVHFAGAIQQQATDGHGSATFVLKRVLDPGQYPLDVIFAGRGDYLATQKQVSILVNPPTATTLAFVGTPDVPVYVGDDITRTVQLRADGRPLADEFVRIFVDGEFLRGANTNADGQVALQLPGSLTAGAHIISATLRGTANQAGATVALPLQLLPRVLELRTIPPMPGVRVGIGSAILETDAKGIAHMDINQSGAMTATLLPYQSPDAGTQAEFDRWSDGVLSTTRKLRLSSDVTTTYQLGFNISHPVILHFVEEASGREVEARRLSSIMLVTSAGEAISVNATSDGLQWLKANRIIRLEQTLLASPVTYQLRKITVDGVNVVNEGQQRFKVEPHAQWTMKLQMHDLQVEVRDALLGTPLGKGLRLDYPDGDSRHVSLDSEGRMHLASLSRGNYTVTVQEAQGIRSPTPIVLSRNREVNIAVISYLDLAIAGGAVALIALAALLIGRRKSLPRLLHALR